MAALSNPSGPLRVLIAEDNGIHGRLAKHLLEEQQCQVDVVGNGREAVQAFRQATYDLILMDCRMPRLDGYAAAKLIRHLEAERERDHRVPIIAVTAVEGMQNQARCRQVGMDACLHKPLRPDMMKELLLHWLAAAHG